MFLNGAFSNSQLARYLALRQPVQLAKGKDLPATVGKRCDQRGNVCQFLPIGDNPLRCRGVFRDCEHLHVRLRIDGDDA
jgi:hypothetical protein